MNEAVIAALAILGVMGQVALALFAVVVVLRVVGVEGPWLPARLAGRELALGGLRRGADRHGREPLLLRGCALRSLQAVLVPARRDYPLVSLALPAFWNDRRAARYLLPLPVVGLGIALWHILVERGVVEETQSCTISAPGGCGTRWIEEFGYVTIPTLAATGFALLAVVLAFAAFRPAD